MSKHRGLSWAVVSAAMLLVSPSFSAAHASSASASVQVVVAQPQPVAAGTNFDYVINVNNEGPDVAANVQLTFPLPAGTFFQAESAPGGWTCNAIAPGTMAPTVTCTSPALAPGTAAFTITASTPPTASGTFSTAATVSSTTPDPKSNDNTFPVDVIVQPSTDFSAMLTAAPNPVNAGSNLTWTMTATNNGPSAAADATVSLPLPAATTFVSVSAPPGWSCTAPAVGTNGTVSCSLSGSMNPATSATFTVISRVVSSTTSGTPISMIATVSSSSDSVPANNSATASVQSAVLFDVGISKTRTPGPVLSGGPLQYTIAVTSFGPSDAPIVTMSDVLPATLTFVSLIAPAGWTCITPAVGANGTVTCSIPSMISGGAATFTLNVVVAPATASNTSINNTATVSTSTPDSNATNNSSTASAVVAASLPALSEIMLVFLAAALVAVSLIVMRK